MKMIEEYLEKFEKAAVGFNNQDRRVLAQDFYVPLDKYLDFSYAHNGYRDVLQHFKKKEGPPPANPVKAKNVAGERATELNISGINMKNQLKHLTNETSNLKSRLWLTRLRALHQQQRAEQAGRCCLGAERGKTLPAKKGQSSQDIQIFGDEHVMQ